MSTKVLIVDTDEAFAGELARTLTDRGFTVASIPHANAAVAFLREHDVDVVLLEVSSRDEGTLQTVRAAKLLSPLAQVITLARADLLDVAISAMKLGAYDCIVKPGTIEEIEKKIANARQLKIAQEERIKRAEVDRLVMKREW